MFSEYQLNAKEKADGLCLTKINNQKFICWGFFWKIIFWAKCVNLAKELCENEEILARRGTRAWLLVIQKSIVYNSNL